MAASTKKPDDPLLRVDSTRLQLVREYYQGTKSPARVVAAAAIFTANKIVSDLMDSALAPLKLSKAKFEILGLLANSSSGQVSLRHLTRTTLHHPATMTYTIDSLEKAKLVKRRPDPTDRRGVLAEITAAGRKKFHDAEVALDEIDWGMGRIGDQAAIKIAELLAPLQARAEPSQNQHQRRGRERDRISVDH